MKILKSICRSLTSVKNFKGKVFYENKNYSVKL